MTGATLQLILGFTPLPCPLGVPYTATHRGGGCQLLFQGLAGISLVLRHSTSRPIHSGTAEELVADLL